MSLGFTSYQAGKLFLIGMQPSGRDAEPRCGVHVIDLDTGATAEWLRIDGVVQELYDVIALPGVVRPMVIGFQTDEIQRSISIDDR